MYQHRGGFPCTDSINKANSMTDGKAIHWLKLTQFDYISYMLGFDKDEKLLKLNLAGGGKQRRKNLASAPPKPNTRTKTNHFA